ncbi:MAG TPA: response regulator [Bacillota bacterium]
MPEKVLVVDDEPPIAEILRFNLEREGYQVITAYDGEQAVQMALSELPDVVVLDIMLPGIDGFEACRRIRRRSAVPIIMLTAKEAERDKIHGLDLGADDYVTKPFSPQELIARIKAILRRAQGALEQSDDDGRIYCGELLIDCQNHRVFKAEREVNLTAREFALLEYLARHAGRIFSREHLLREVWGYQYPGDIRTVDVTVRRLREKIEDDPGEPRFLLTKRGVGYFFRKF